jgi:nucleoside-diphosphate-sugar epimerase
MVRMRILVIGGTNFIGPPVIAKLHQLGHRITVYHRGQHEPELPSNVQHVHSPSAGIPVLHFPAELTHPAPDVVLHTFPVGRDDMVAAADHFAGKARRMVALSSGDVYRAYGRLLGIEPCPLEPMPLGENAPLRETRYPYRHLATGPGDWTFHYEKILAEQAVMNHAGLPGTVLRLPAVYGPGDPYRRLRPYIKRMHDGRPVILLDDVQYNWRWTHGYLENVAAAITQAVVDERASGRTFNLGERETPTLGSRVQSLAQVMSWRGRIVRLEPAKTPQHLRLPYEPRQDLVMDSSRLRSDLGFSEAATVEEGLRDTIAWEPTHSPAEGDPGAREYAAEDAAAA